MPRYTPSNCIGRNVAVYLDGVRQEDVLEADDDLGFVIKLARDEAGNIIAEGDEVKREIKLGKVQVTFPVMQG